MSADNPFPSLLLGNDDDGDDDEDALLHLSGQEEAMLPGSNPVHVHWS